MHDLHLLPWDQCKPCHPPWAEKILIGLQNRPTDGSLSCNLCFHKVTKSLLCVLQMTTLKHGTHFLYRGPLKPYHPKCGGKGPGEAQNYTNHGFFFTMRFICCRTMTIAITKYFPKAIKLFSCVHMTTLKFDLYYCTGVDSDHVMQVWRRQSDVHET